MTVKQASLRRRGSLRYRGGDSIRPSGMYWIWYVLPALLVYVVFMAYPLIDSVRLSLYTGAVGKREFVGLANYVRLFTHSDASARFWNALGNTWVFFAYHMLVQNVLGMLFAVLLTNRMMRGSGFYQSVIFLPCTIARVYGLPLIRPTVKTERAAA